MLGRWVGEAAEGPLAGAPALKTVKTFALMNRRTSIAIYLLDYMLCTTMIFFHLLAHPFRYRLIHVNNMPNFLIFET